MDQPAQDEHVNPSGEPRVIERIVSGGQTGVDRAALDVAIELNIPHGGWCPAGRIAEDGAIPPHYQLRETVSAKYDARTRANVLDSDATLIIAHGEPTGGTLLTRRIASRQGKPFLVVDLDDDLAVERTRTWLAENDPRVLNVAGPRESASPGVSSAAKDFLLRALSAD